MAILRLLFHCKNRIGLVRDTSAMLSEAGLDILSYNSFEDKESNHFFIRAECESNGKKDAKNALNKSLSKFALASQECEYSIRDTSEKKKIAILVSNQLHCLNELLHRQKSGVLGAEVVCVISNHPQAEAIALLYGIKFAQIKVTDSNKCEKEILRLVKGTDFLVLARYMQVLSQEFLQEYKMPIINVHHSLLPTFEGAKPYEKAFERGVKMIGASAHLVTKKLDGGPIISQVVREVSHEDNISDFKDKGAAAEQEALSNAVKLFANDKVLTFNGRTFIL